MRRSTLLLALVLICECAALKAQSTSTNQVCDSKSPKAPCINQPYEGDTQVTGLFDKGASIKITVNTKDLDAADLHQDGTFTKAVDTLSQYDTVTATETDTQNATHTLGPVTVNPPQSATSGQSLYTLGMAGIDITSTTSNGPSQQYLAEFKLTAPLSLASFSKSKKPGRDPLDSRLWAWFDPKIASVPTPKTSMLSSLTSTNTALAGLGQLALGDITQSLELHGGLEAALVKPRNGVLFGNQDKASLALSFVIGGGFVTPFNSATGANQEFDLTTGNTSGTPSTGNVTGVLQQFTNDSSLLNQSQFAALHSFLTKNCPTATSCSFEHVAFVLPNRSRFYRSYFGGLRVKTFFFNTGCNGGTGGNIADPDQCQVKDIFPGTLDATVGQDETVTHGALQGLVLTLSANYPFPGVSSLRIFGSAYLGLRRNLNSPALAIPATQTFVPLNDPSVVVIPAPPQDQDYFRIGFAVDIGQAIKSLKTSQSSSSSKTAGKK